MTHSEFCRNQTYSLGGHIKNVFFKKFKMAENQIRRTYGFFEKNVEFDPKNFYTKFRLNRTYIIGVMNFKVKNHFSLGSIRTQLPNKVQNFMSTIYHLTGICENILKERNNNNNNNNNKPAQKLWA